MIEQVFHGEVDSAVNNRIRCRAYELYEQRGGIHGFDLQDWFNAEREILNGLRSGETMSLSPEERKRRRQAGGLPMGS